MGSPRETPPASKCIKTGVQRAPARGGKLEDRGRRMRGAQGASRGVVFEGKRAKRAILGPKTGVFSGFLFTNEITGPPPAVSGKVLIHRTLYTGKRRKRHRKRGVFR